MIRMVEVKQSVYPLDSLQSQKVSERQFWWGGLRAPLASVVRQPGPQPLQLPPAPPSVSLTPEPGARLALRSAPASPAGPPSSKFAGRGSGSSSSSQHGGEGKWASRPGVPGCSYYNLIQVYSGTPCTSIKIGIWKSVTWLKYLIATQYPQGLQGPKPRVNTSGNKDSKEHRG